MKVRQAKKINREDFSDKEADFAEKMGEYLNTFNNDVSRALDRKLTINDNFDQEIRKVTLKTDSSGLPLNFTSLRSNLSSINGILVIHCLNTSGTPETQQPYIRWVRSTDPQFIDIKQVYGLSPESTYELKLLIIGE